MSLESDIKVLGQIDLFGGLSSDQLRLLAFGAETVRLKTGRDLYRENSPADCAFIVVSGAVTLTREVAGRREEVATVGEGAMLGELALIAPTNRATGATAAADCELLRLTRKLFRRMLEEYPETAARLHERLSADLQNMLEKITRLGPAFGP